MRAKISVRVSKFLHTLLRNMRRRRKATSFPSPFPIILLFVLVVLLRNLNVSSISTHFQVSKIQPVTPVSHDTTTYETVPKQPAPAVEQDNVVSTVKREQYMERRHAERRAIHRRIVEKRQEDTGIAQQPVSQVEAPVENKPYADSRNMKEDEHKEASIERPGSETNGVSHEKKVERPHAEEHNTPHEEKSMKTAETDSSKGISNKDHASETEKDKKTERVSGVNGIPAGARVHGKLADYGGSLGGTEDGMVRGQNVTRVSYTLFKIMKLFGFVSLVDSPAGSHTEWMAEVVERMSFDHPSFRYIGVDNEAGIERARKSIGEVVDGEFVISNVEEWVGNGSDVVFHWTEMDGGELDARDKGYMEHIRKVIVAAKKGDNGYIVFGQFPRLNGPQPTYRNGKWIFAGDEKEEPFLYNEHVRGVVPMGNGRESYMLYMTFYSLRSMPLSELQV